MAILVFEPVDEKMACASHLGQALATHSVHGEYSVLTELVNVQVDQNLCQFIMLALSNSDINNVCKLLVYLCYRELRS